MPPKYAAPYSLVKTPIEQTKFYSTYDAKSKQTNQIWLARVIHHEIIDKFELSEHVAYNEEVLLNLKEKESVIYVNQIFTKDESTFLIQEKHQIRLSTYLESKKVLPADEVQKIIKDVYNALCDIYSEGYVHRNIRPEHIVLVSGETKEKDQWKIDTLVLDNQEFSVDSPFTWKKATASPEEKSQKDELSEEMLDAQIVWNFGYLALQLISGNDFMRTNMSRDSDIKWIKIEETCSKAPPLYELIEKSFRFKYSDRIPLKRFFQLRIFDDCQRAGCGEYFLTASKIFKAKTFSSMSLNLKSMNMKSMNMMSRMLAKNAPSPKLMNSIPEQSYEEEEEINSIRGSFLSGISSYLNYIESNQPSNRSNENKSIIEFYFIKLSAMFLQKGSKETVSSRLKDQALSMLNLKSKIIKRIKPAENYLLRQFNIDQKQNYTLPQLIPIFNKLCGYAYSRVKESCEKTEKLEVVKAVAYFGFAAILVNINEWRELNKIFMPKKGQTYLEVFESNSPEHLVKLSQELINKYFKTG